MFLLAGGMGVLLGMPQPLAAVSTHFWRLATQPEFARGRLTHLSLGPEGALSLAPALVPVFDTGQPLIWSAAVDGRGNVYLATGNSGRLYRLTPAMLAQALHAGRLITPGQALFFTASEPEIFAVATGPDGAAYAATSPNGKVYRIAPDGKSSVYFDPHARYIWSLCFLHGMLYVGTGSQGVIYRVAPGPGGQGHGQQFFRTAERQVTVLAAGPDGTLLAGTDPGGLIFRINAAGRARVLYDAPLREIRALATGPDGTVYASAQGAARSKLGQEQQEAEQAEAAGPQPGMTVVAESRQHQPAQAPGGLPGGGGEVSITMGPTQVLSPDGAASPPQVSQEFHSAIYRISPNGQVDTQWSSERQNAGPVWVQGTEPLFATDHLGRIYRLDPGQVATLLAQSGQQAISQFFRADGALWAAASNSGVLYRFGVAPASKGSYVSPIHDAGSIAQWGHLNWLASNAPPGALRFVTRSGDSARPDSTWSLWSAPLTEPGQAITSPPARFIQWKVTFNRAPDGPSPRLDSVTLPYLPANHAPVLRDFQALTAATQPQEGAEKKIQGIQLKWDASDPDHDPLTYRVWFQIEGETGWTPYADHLRATILGIAPGRLPDGTYKFKVQASDALANPPQRAKTAVAISGPATMDTTPPAVRVTSARARKQAAVVRFTASDAIAALSRAQFALDGGPWTPLLADTGIIDSRRESFTVTTGQLAPGQHIVMLRVYDRGGNRGSAAAMVTVP